MTKIDRTQMINIIANPKMQTRMIEIGKNSPLSMALSHSDFEKWLDSEPFGTGATVKISDIISLSFTRLFNPVPGSIAGAIGTNRIDSNLKESEIASRIGLLLDDYFKLEDGYYNYATFTGESSELSVTIYPIVINGEKYYLLHDGGHRLFFICLLLCGCVFNKVRRDGQHDKYIDLFNRYIAGQNYNSKGAMTDLVDRMISHLPFRVKFEHENFDQAVRNECKPYKNNESLHKHWSTSELYKYLFQLHQTQNSVLNFVANSKQGPFKFCNDLALTMSLYTGYYVTDSKVGTKSFYYDVTNYATPNQFSRVCSAITRYLNLYKQPDVYPFLRAYTKIKTPKNVRYGGYKNGTTMVNSNISVLMVLDAVYNNPAFIAQYNSDYNTWKSTMVANYKNACKQNGKKKLPKPDCSFRNFFESIYLNTFDMSTVTLSNTDILEARIVLAEYILEFFEKNSAYFAFCGKDICQRISHENITDGVGRPSKYFAVVSDLKSYFGRRMKNFYNQNSISCTNKVSQSGNVKKGVANP